MDHKALVFRVFSKSISKRRLYLVYAISNMFAVCINPLRRCTFINSFKGAHLVCINQCKISITLFKKVHVLYKPFRTGFVHNLSRTHFVLFQFKSCQCFVKILSRKGLCLKLISPRRHLFFL